MEDDLGWSEQLWHVVTGCTRVSQGCRHCRGELRWHLATHPGVHTRKKFVQVAHHPLRLDEPFHSSSSLTIHVAPGSDLFHEQVPMSFVAAVFAVMAATPWHTYQIMSRRHDRMMATMAKLANMGGEELARAYESYTAPKDDADSIRARILEASWPLSNVWMGAVIEDQATAESGIPALLSIQAEKRGLHVEPLMGEIHLAQVKWQGGDWSHFIDWVVVGSRHFQQESFPLPWLSVLQQECRDNGIPFVLKNIHV